ncbi:MAG: hypothetical protein WCZ99_01865 [Candidatus Paceibacterota bacterium]|nr:hypothetical protein [Candidatus Paceibacterota bacterium]MDD3072628.1 hypothetical protein [Candidatus Paceibacterota bacterium]MDD4201682.1 hypothetical protein [Candidatus Paceibacterota bacterium]MDD4897497.1 hypothetical protein [Candidatus Paceibacterota bacterium]
MKKNTEKGFSLFLSILLISIILAVIFGLSAMLLSQHKMIKEVGKSVNIFYAAETGAERALFEVFKTEGNIEHIYEEELDSGSEYTVHIYCCTPGAGCDFVYEPAENCPVIDNGSPKYDENCDASRFCIYSTGSFDGTKKTLEIKIY